MNNKSGFTLLEVLITIAIIAILGAVVLPRIQIRSPRAERQRFVARLNALTQLAWRSALTTHRAHRVSFDFDTRTIQIFAQQQPLSKSKAGAVTEQFEPLRGAAVASSMPLPRAYDIKQFIVEGFDEMTRFAGRKTAEVWFYVVPEGLVQQVTIRMVDTSDVHDGKPRTIMLELNPFNAEFTPHES